MSTCWNVSGGGNGGGTNAVVHSPEIGRELTLERARVGASGVAIVRVPSAQPIRVAVVITEVSNVEKHRATRITISWEDVQRGHSASRAEPAPSLSPWMAGI